MKTASITITLLIFSLVCFSENFLNSPESVVYDSINNQYFVSNWEDGKIISIDEAGNQMIFNDVLQHAAGMHINNNILYVCSYTGDLSGVVGFNLSTAEIVFHKQINGMVLPNGITSDASEFLYVSGYLSGKIFKINFLDTSHTVLVETGLNYPNGTEFDFFNNRLLVMNEGSQKAPIFAIDINSGEISTVVETNISSNDGLTIDENGNIYFSSWATGKVYSYDESYTNPPVVVSSGHANPADIFFNNVSDILVVPNFGGNSVSYIPIVPSGNNKIENEEINITRTFPNPFRNIVNIEFKLESNILVNINIFDINGNNVAELLNKHLNRGEHSLVWNGTNKNGNDCDAGIYFVRTFYNGKNKSFKIMKQ